MSNQSNSRLQGVFSLLAYADPWSSPVGDQLDPVKREPVCAALNSAILGKCVPTQQTSHLRPATLSSPLSLSHPLSLPLAPLSLSLSLSLIPSLSISASLPLSLPAPISPSLYLSLPLSFPPYLSPFLYLSLSTSLPPYLSHSLPNTQPTNQTLTMTLFL